MDRMTRGIRAATNAAEFSTEKYLVGAAIYFGARLISIGWNSKKTSPNCESIFNWHHAETAALVGLSRKDLSRATIYVVRLKKSGVLGMAKPCLGCQRALRASGIRRVYYTDSEGKVRKLLL